LITIRLLKVVDAGDGSSEAWTEEEEREGLDVSLHGERLAKPGAVHLDRSACGRMKSLRSLVKTTNLQIE